MKQVIITTNAPTPIGPYNQAILKGNTLYTSGQIAINPANGHLVLEDIENAKNAGIDHFLSKPIDTEKLKKLLVKYSPESEEK